MKKLVCFSFVLSVCFFSSCKDDPEFIAKESLITKEKSNIDRLGKYKLMKEFLLYPDKLVKSNSPPNLCLILKTKY